MIVELPWPPSALKPNGPHGHWSAKSGAAKRYRGDCLLACRAAGVGPVVLDSAHLTICFCPPDRRRRDLDNMLAQIKYGLDAVSEAVAIDDSNFGLTILRGDPVKGGAVVVTIGEA